MNISAAEIESIVRKVLGTLSADASAPADLLGPSKESSSSSTVQLRENVISVDTLRNRLNGIRSIEVLSRAVVTPAVRDLCRERGIVITRVTEMKSMPNDTSPVSNPLPAGSKPQRLFVTGAVLWLKGLEKQLCPKQTLVSEIQTDDAATIRSVATAIRAGHRGALAIVNSPFSACWQAARDEALRPVVLSQWADLDDAMAEVPTNVLIVSAKRWNIAATANIARRFLEQSKRKS